MGSRIATAKREAIIMVIERNFSKYVVFSGDSILSALNKANTNSSRLIFAVSEIGVLEGVITDGDLRRWLTTTNQIDLDLPASLIMNKHFQFTSVNTKNSDIQALLSTKIKAVPLVDDNQRLVAVAVPTQNQYELNGRIISEDSPAFIIAEIGNNHNGSLKLAKQLIDKAMDSGADCAKFQMRDMSALYKTSSEAVDDSADLGAQYTLDLLSRVQLSDNDMFKAFDYCTEKGITPLCTPWDLSSLEKLEKYGLCGYKIASADFTNYELIDAVAQTGKIIICSTGMSTEEEIKDGIQHIQESGAPFVLLHCNSTYPAPFKDINLNYLSHLKKLSGGLVGYSGHERDINIAIAAVSLGAKVVEKHFTLDKNMEGNDHKVSLLPNEFKKMVEGIRQIEEAMGSTNERRLSQGEMMNRENLAKSLVASVDITEGTIITDEMIMVRSPGQGLQPCRRKDLIGTVIKSNKKTGEFFFNSDLGGGAIQASDYSFTRPWGIPVRYHDLQKMRLMSNMDLLEIHLSFKDMELDFNQYITEILDLDLVVHAPELFKGDHTLDLCSCDEDYRFRSISEMQRVINLTRKLAANFRKTERPCIVTNMGGFSNNGHIHFEKREELYTILEDSLSHLDTQGVELIPQTMPPFPWHFGGQQFHNLFMDADSIIDFCKKNTMRICLDTSHSKLACNFMKQSFTEFTKKVAPYVAHMHIADAEGVDGEGLQITEGEIDWPSFFKVIDQYAPSATFIPEIWQGHKNGGEGAWKALEILSETA